jgi:hypothetical protein
VTIEAGTGRHRQPSRHIEVVLREGARGRVRVRKPRGVDWLKPIALDRNAAYNRVTHKRPSDSELREATVMIVPLANLAESMVLVLRGPRSPQAPHNSVGHESLK